MVTGPSFDDLRADDRVPVDFPGRKLAVYPNPGGQVVLLSAADGEPPGYMVIEPTEVVKVCTALMRAAGEAKQAGDLLNAQYETYVVIENAKESR